MATSDLDGWQKEVGKKIVHLKKVDGFNILRTDEQD
jgi:hypothetical protein